MKSFKEFVAEDVLVEGGNITGAKGETADPISTKDRFKTAGEIKNSLNDLHKSFHEETGKHLFGKNRKALVTGSAFSGSSAHLVNHTISDAELHKHKPTMGDVDTQVPAEHLSDLHKHLHVGRKFGKYTVAGVKKHGHEVSILAKHENGQHHQIDFEGVEYHHEEPTQFETFAHSSHWEDTKNGIKGASHKQLLNATGGSTHKFSITHGLAKRTDDKKAPVEQGEKDPKKISKTLFGHEHPIASFDDVAHAIKKHISPEKHQGIVDKFAERGHPHAVERLKSILGTKKINEASGYQKFRKKKLGAASKLIKRHLATGDTKSAQDVAKLYGLPKPVGEAVTTDKWKKERLKGCKCPTPKRNNPNCPIHGVKESIYESSDGVHHAAVTLPMGTSPSSHIGHQDLVDEMKRHAPTEHCHVSLSDKAEYLSHAKRKEIMQKQSPKGVNVHVIHGAGESIRKAYDKLPAGKKVLHLVGGQERQGMLDGLKKSLEAGKVKEMGEHKFDEVHVHNPQVARRTTSNGGKTSGTNFRKALASGDEQTIKDHLGSAYSQTLSKHLQKGVKSGKIEINRK